jgi:hypothetical protein
MPTWLRRLALAVAMLTMPLQGATATLSIVLCQGDAKAHVMHSPDGAAHDAHLGDQSNEGGMGGNPAHHPCCGHVLSAPPALTCSGNLTDSPIRAFAPDALQDLFVPDRPQRPPLA